MSTFLSKLNGGMFGGKEIRKSLTMTMPKKLKGGPLGLSTSILSQNIKKMKGDPLVSPSIVIRGKKTKNLFGSVRYAKWFNLTP